VWCALGESNQVLKIAPTPKGENSDERRPGRARGLLINHPADGSSRRPGRRHGVVRGEGQPLDEVGDGSMQSLGEVLAGAQPRGR
jgi:hypothetical protein